MRSLDRGRPGVATLAAAVIALLWCVGAGVSVGIDPMLAVEVAGAAVLALWTSLLAGDLWRASRLRRRLDHESSVRVIDGVALRVLPGWGPEAFVLGVLRPTVYLGDASMDLLEADELAAVIHHEDHHRRTLAPLRASAVEAWLRLVGRWSTARQLLSARLEELERSADAHAIRRGVRPASLAAALIKVDRSTSVGLAFSGAADHRISALLDAAAGRAATRLTPLPYEWLPLVITIAITIGCHLGDPPPLG